MNRRIVRVIVPGRAPATVLVDSTGRLPSFELAVAPGDTTVAAVSQTVLPTLGFDGHILDCFIDQSGVPDPDRSIPVFVELGEPAVDWIEPEGWRSIPVSGAELEIEESLLPRLADWLAERGGRSDVDPLRPAWTRAGWFERVVGWITEAFAEARLAPPTDVVQFRHWGISAVMRVESEHGRYWFKAVSEHFRREAGITAFLDREVPGSVGRVIASDSEKGWLLLADLGSAPAEPDPHDHREPYQHLMDIQRRFVDRESELVAAGCARRPLASVPDDLATALQDPIVREWIDVRPERARQIVDWLHDAVRRVEQLGLPDRLVHGDFHPGNVAALGDGRRVVFDWSDAAISKPFVDVVTWASWMADDVAGCDALWATFAETWSELMPAEVWMSMRTTLEGVSGAYHVVSYAGIVKSTDRLRRPEHGNGLLEFFAFVDDAVPV